MEMHALDRGVSAQAVNDRTDGVTDTSAEPSGPPATDELLVEVADSWDLCREQVEEALRVTGESNPFLSLPWLETWWEQWGRGKHLQVFLFRRNGTCVGFAPLWYSETLGLREYFFVGHRKSSYLGVVSADGEQQAILEALMRSLARSGRAALLHLTDLNSSAPTFKALARSVSSVSSGVNVFPLYACPYAALSEDWDSFFQGLMGRKHRAQMRAAERRLASLGELRLRLITDSQDISSLLPSLQSIHRARFEGSYNPSLEGRHGEFMGRIVRLMAGDNLVLASLELDGGPVAFLLGIRMGGALIDYIPAFDPALERYSPGHVLIMRLLQWMASHGYRVLDFSKGDEAYKRRWSNGETTNYVALVAVNPNLTLKTYISLRKVLLRARLWLRARGYARTLKRGIGTVRRVGDRLKRGPIRRARVRRIDAPGDAPGRPFSYNLIRGFPVEARRALVGFCYPHHRGQPLLFERGPSTAALYDERSGEGIEVSW